MFFDKHLVQNQTNVTPGHCSGVKILKYCDGRDVSCYGAFPRDAVIDYELWISTGMWPGVMGVTLCIHRDELGIAPSAKDCRALPMTFLRHEQGMDVYGLSLDTASLCKSEPDGLFYYRFRIDCGNRRLETDSINNVDFELTERDGRDFRLLIHQKDYTTPAWFGKGVMYHVFVDRFFCGEGKVGQRDDVIMNPDWESGIPQYPENPGDELANNMFFGGNLWGVAEKLPYLQELGVKVIYLSPIFKAYSNHKYDTGDYLTVDECFGGEAAFEHLLAHAEEQGIKIILDGVFNHTGDDSLYFNRYGKYPAQGAYQSPDSVYRDWYSFKQYPDSYDCWWGIRILPRLNHDVEMCRRFFTSPDGVGARYVRAGIGGWRLDVADELNDAFLDEFRTSVKAASDGEAVIIGEVWENAADKIAYGNRRKYLSGRQLDSVMNYPVRMAILSFVKDGDAEWFYHILTELYGSYPRCTLDSLMNLLGTHDTERILTVLGSDEEDFDRSNEQLAHATLSLEKRLLAIERLKIAATIQYTVFGIPSVFYGDEMGMEGYHDPFCRRPFPWHKQNDMTCRDLTDYYRALGALRAHPALQGGDFRVLTYNEHAVVYTRTDPTTGEGLLVAANCGDEPFDLELDPSVAFAVRLQSGRVDVDGNRILLYPNSVCVCE